MDFEIEHLRKLANEISSLGMIVPLIFSLTNIFRPEVLSENTKINWFLTSFLFENGIWKQKNAFLQKKLTIETWSLDRSGPRYSYMQFVAVALPSMFGNIQMQAFFSVHYLKIHILNGWIDLCATPSGRFWPRLNSGKNSFWT